MDVPRITITPEAVAYAREKGGAVTLRPSPRHGCCGGTVAVPVAEAGAPADPSGYDSLEIDGVRVYLDPEVRPAQPLRIGLDRLFGLRSLFVEGAEARM